MVTVLPVLATACGGGGASEDPAKGEAAQVSATTSSTTAPSAVPITPTGTTGGDPAPPAGLSPHQVVVVDRTGDLLTVSAGSGDRDLTELYSADLALPGWDTVNIRPYADYTAHPFSADFSKVLFYGRPTGLEAHHIGILDLSTGESQDLTAPRQGSDFEDPILCEDSPGYVSEVLRRRPGDSSVAPPGAPLLNRSERVVLHGRTGTLGRAAASCFGDESSLTSLADPTTAMQVPATQEALSQRIVASEDGMYQFGRVPDPGLPRDEQSVDNYIDAFFTPDGREVVVTNCRPDGLDQYNSQFGQSLLGWVGPRTVALSIGEPNVIPEAGFDWRTATLEANGEVTCAGGIPQTGRAIGEMALSFDGEAILFTAEGVSGPEQYRQPLDATSQEPASYPELPAGGDGDVIRDIYRVGPTG